MLGTTEQDFMLVRTFSFVAILCSCCGALAAAPSTTKIADRIEQVTFSSPSFGAKKSYSVVLPANYDAQKSDWPVLYLLHGRGRNDRSLIDDPVTREALLNASFVTVLPNGEDGWYLDSQVGSKHSYAKLLEETIHDAESRFHLSREPRKRAIAGWSMGGYGSMRFAVTHPQQFAMVATILGLLDFPRSGLPEGQSHSIPAKTFGTDEDEWKKINPLNSAEQLRGTAVLLITADQAFDRTMNENFHARLQQLKIEHEWIVLKGTHHIDVVKQAVPIVIDRVQRTLDGTAVDESSTHAN
jgi:S-formylglutathione hydrolase FrmB